MKKIILIPFILLSSVFVLAQNKNIFSIKLNDKEIIKSQSIPETKAVSCTIKKSTLKLKGNILKINIAEKEPVKNWHKVFVIMDQNDSEISRSIQKTISGNFDIPLNLPANFNKGTIKIFTINEPDDPNAAATMRLRTFPLANITIN